MKVSAHLWCLVQFHHSSFFLFLLAADAAASFITSGSGIFYTWQCLKKEVNHLQHYNKQIPCMPGVLIFHIKSEW
jgi:hypothetical protein